MSYVLKFRVESGEQFAADERKRRLKADELKLLAKSIKPQPIILPQRGKLRALCSEVGMKNVLFAFDLVAGRLQTVVSMELESKASDDQIKQIWTWVSKQLVEGAGYIFAQYPCMKLGANKLEEVYVYPSADKPQLLSTEQKAMRKPKK